MQIDKLQVLFRKIRESQGISQTELATAAGKTQGAITQFEHMRATISENVLKEMAPTLNLNPDFIEKKTGNPFKQADREKIIKMFIPESSVGDLDFSLIEFIAGCNEKASFFFLKPSMRHQPRQRFNLHSACALLIKDSDENVFIFKRKRVDEVFTYLKLREELLKFAEKKGKYLEIKVLTVPDSLYKRIQEWDELKVKEFSTLLIISGMRENKELLTRLIDKMIFLENDSINRQNLTAIKNNIAGLNAKEMDTFILGIIPQILETSKKFIKFGQL